MTFIHDRKVFYLSPHIRCLDFDEGAILLDLSRDAYSGLDAAAVQHLRSIVANWPTHSGTARHTPTEEETNVDGLIDRLRARGILRTDPVRDLDAPPPAVTAAFSTRRGSAPLRYPCARSLIMAVILVLLLYKRPGGLVRIVDWIRERQTHLRDTQANQIRPLSTLLSRFLRLRTLLYTAHRRCLFDSLVLSVYLTRAGVPCTLVIAVARKPFLAHAWVQHLDKVLNDTAESVQAYQPLLAIGENSRGGTPCAI